MNRRFLWYTAAVLLPLLSLAPPVTADTTDTELLEHLRNNAPDCGRFEQSRWLADFGMHLNSSGEFQRLANGLMWRTTQPIESELALTSDNPELPLGYQAVLPVFNSLLAGNLDDLDDYFSTRLSGTTDAWRAELTPRNTQVAAQLTALEVQGAAQLEQITVSFADGDRMDIHLTADACSSPGEAP